ncbi:MAG TPA: FlgD immunoglobulin-like domain containing protein [Cryomorphaceae bacterium]|nr:FlgD immunoglobulin-like domain containing protein [Cryomorphaceae bacterium]
MKKQFYLMLTLSLTASIAFAQSARENTQLITKKGFVEVDQPNKTKTVNTPKGEDVVLWSDDFSDPSKWDIYNESTPPIDWEIITDVNASPVAALNPIALTTADNGFAFVNGDPAGDGSIQNCFIEYNEDFSLEGSENVSFVFEQNSRNFATSYFVDFSTDGGNSWIPFQVNLDLETNTNTENPEVVTISVGDIIGNEPSVRLRFNFVADWGWHWAVDDLQIIETPANDVVLNAAYFDEYILIGQTDYSDTDYIPNLEYSEYRQNHVRPFTFVADVTNQGAETSTGVTFLVTVNTPDGPESFSSAIDELAAGEDTVITIEDEMLAAFMTDGGLLGDYTVDFEIAINEEDALPGNNTVLSKSFTVGTEKMTNDLGEAYSGWYNISQAAIWGNQFTVEEQTEVNYIQFALVDATDDPTVIGEEVFVNLRQGSVLEAEGPDNEMERFFADDELAYVISEGDVSTDGLANYITIFFPDDATITLEPGVVYQAEFEVPEVGAPIATIPVSNRQEAGAGVLYDFLDVSGGPQGWFTLGANTPNVRAGFGAPTSSSDLGSLNFSMGQNFPNPVANGSTRISWELKVAAENVTFAITDNTGKMIYQKDLGDRPAGVQEDIVLDNLKLAAGVYQYGLKVGNNRIVRKMVVTK